MKDGKFYISALFLIVVTFVALYFSYVNSVFSNKVLVSVNVQGSIHSFLPEAKAKEIIAARAAAILPQHLQVKIANEEFSVPINELNPRLDISQITNFGKGNDLTKVLGDSISILSGKIVNDNDLVFVFDADAVVEKLPYHNNGLETAYLENGIVHNCINHSYDIDYEFENLASLIRNAVIKQQPLALNLEDIATSATDISIIKYCNHYNEQLESLRNIIDSEIKWQDYLEYDLTSPNKSNLELIEEKKEKLLNEFALLDEKYKLDFDPGSYIIKNNNLYLYKKYTAGRSVNPELTLEKFNQWLDEPSAVTDIIAYDQVPPDYLSMGYNIINLTKVIGVGESRLDIIRDGYLNYRVGHSQRALEAINGFVLEPGQEFSFYNDTGIKKNQIIVGIGVCNASTTMFRLALFSALPITDRSPHTFYVESYDYPKYPINNVEATFFGGPIVDLKFVNDLNAPILLITTIDRSANDGFQYHTVTAYSSPDTPDRIVKLVDFKKWDEISNYKFKSSFTRQILDESGHIIKEDVFSANYYD